MNRMVHRIQRISAVLIVLMLTLCLLPVQAFMEANPVPEASKALGVIYGEFTAFIEGGWYDVWSSGTGFAVAADSSKTIFVTNSHVVLDADNELIDDVKVIYEGKTYDSKVLYYNAEHSDKTPDIAVLQTLKPVDGIKTLSILPKDKVEVGSSVWAMGYPGSTNRSKERPDDYVMTSTKGNVSKIDEAPYGQVGIWHDAIIDGGNSGGPLVNESGAVVGVNTYSWRNSNGELIYSIALSTEYLDAILTDLGVDFKTAGEALGAKSFISKENIWIIALIVVGLLIVGGIVAAVSSSKTPAQIPPAPNPNVPNPNNPNVPKPPVTPKRIKVIGGAFTGRTLDIAPGSFTIGRKPECNLVFPEGTPGVSGLHCRLMNQNGQLTITDLGSTYGTFVNGTRLTPNMPMTLNDGSRFYLGDKNNEFGVGNGNFAPIPGPQGVPGQGTRSLMGVAGQYQGRTLPIPASGMTIGRNPGNTLVFSAQTPGVSGNHCRISYQGGSLTITDVGSSYGTFVGGVRIQNNVPTPLAPGAEIWLGTKQNAMKVM